MGDIGPEKLLLLLLIVLLLFGARRLPEIGHSLGKGIREFKRSVSDIGAPLPPEQPPAPRERLGTPTATAAPPDSEVRSDPKRLLS